MSTVLVISFEIWKELNFNQVRAEMGILANSQNSDFQGPDIKCIIWPNFKDQNEWCLQMRKKEKSETYLSKLQKTDDHGK